MKCAVCDREAKKDVYCSLHIKAYENVIATFDQWRKALEISWKEYLSEVAMNPLTGRWAKEVAQHLIKTGGHTDVKDS